MTDRDRKRLTCFINYLNYNMETVKIANFRNDFPKSRCLA